MVDSGAKNSVIRADLIRERSVFDVKVASKTWRSLDFQVLPLIGETNLIVRFDGAVTDLSQVLVMEKAIYPMVLGMDWIERAGAVICVKHGVAIVEVMHGREKEKEALNSVTPKVEITHQISTTNITDHRENVAERTPNLGKSEYDRAVDNLLVMGALVETEEMTVDVVRNEQNLRIKLKHKERIAASSVQFVKVMSPGRRDGTWQIETTRSTRSGKEWVTPGCLVESYCGKMLIPVVNLGAKKVSVRGPWKASVVLTDQVFEVNEEEPSTVGSLQPEGGAMEVEAAILNEKEVNIDPDLNEEEQKELMEVIRRHWRCFLGKKGLTRLVEHRIETGTSNPVHSSPYRVSEVERRVIQKQVQKMREEGIITLSHSPWSSSVVLVRKKNGEIRFCVDYRRLNALTVKDVYPLPRIEDVLHRLSGARFFTSLDLESGFWQVPMAKEHREKTAFVTPDGLFEFLCLPFGLCGAPPTFQRLMDRVLDGLKWTECLVYMDDILVFGGSIKEHNERLHRVLQAIENAGLTLNARKCAFGTSSVVYLGHRIDRLGISPDHTKLEAVRQFPRPNNITKLRAFLGMASFYRRFIHNFASIARPLHNLLKKGADVERDWNQSHEIAMMELKTKLTSSPVLVSDDGVSRIELHTDASIKGVGAVLMLDGEKGLQPVTFISRRLTPAEERYHINELECLALVWSLNRLRHHVYGRHLTVKTDSSVLRWLSQKKDLNGRLARWIITLQEYSIDIQHLSGSSNAVADALSRAPVGTPESTDPVDGILCGVQVAEYSSRQLALLQHADQDIRQMVLLLQGYGDENCALNRRKDFILYEGVLYKKNEKLGRQRLLVVPSIIRRDLLFECHDTPTGGHHGVEKTLAKLSQRYWWKNMKKSVEAYVSTCEFCQPFKARVGYPVGKLCPIPPPKEVFELVAVDHLGPFKKTAEGNHHVIVCIDYLTRWIEVKAVKDTGTDAAVDFLKNNVFLQHGPPRRFISDRGPAFSSAGFAEFLHDWRVHHVMASAEHPETNGLVEKVNGTLVTTLAAFVNFEHNDWDRGLQEAAFAINTAKQSTIQTTPFELVYGRSVFLPHEASFPWPPTDTETHEERHKKVHKWRKIARRLILKKQRKSKANYDLHRKPSPLYKPGDLVLVSRKPRCNGRTKKFLAKFVGPYRSNESRQRATK